MNFDAVYLLSGITSYYLGQAYLTYLLS